MSITLITIHWGTSAFVSGFSMLLDFGALNQVANVAIKRTWEEAVAQKIREQVLAKEQQQDSSSLSPLMVAVVGIPGSGKTTSSQILVDILEDVGAMLVPFDGYHYPLAALQTFPNANDAIYRRGAPDTFDEKSLKRDLNRIRCGKEDIIYFPAFDHARGDPDPDIHEFRRGVHRVVVCEGLYLLHDEGGWEDVKTFFDLTIFVNANVDTCIQRLKIRNKAIPGYTPEEIEIRCDAVDRTNALTVERSKARADLLVDSAAL